MLGKIIAKCIKIHGTAVTSDVLDKIKNQGYKYSTRSGITVASCDATIPPKKAELLAAAEKENNVHIKIARDTINFLSG